jgi:hypothetical protein
MAATTGTTAQRCSDARRANLPTPPRPFATSEFVLLTAELTAKIEIVPLVEIATGGSQYL